MPIKKKRVWNSQFELPHVVCSDAKHASTLDVSVLLNFVSRISGEEHRKESIERYPPGHDVSPYRKREECRRFRRSFVVLILLIEIAVHHDYDITINVLQNISDELIFAAGVSLFGKMPHGLGVSLKLSMAGIF